MNYQNNKSIFIEKMKSKTKLFAIDTIKFCDTLEVSKSSQVIAYQLIKSATSTGANYRAACRGRSSNEFRSKLSITLEEADESQYWLEIIEGSKIVYNKTEFDKLFKNISEIIAILTKARQTAYS